MSQTTAPYCTERDESVGVESELPWSVRFEAVPVTVIRPRVQQLKMRIAQARLPLPALFERYGRACWDLKQSDSALSERRATVNADIAFSLLLRAHMDLSTLERELAALEGERAPR